MTNLKITSKLLQKLLIFMNYFKLNIFQWFIYLKKGSLNHQGPIKSLKGSFNQKPSLKLSQMNLFIIQKPLALYVNVNAIVKGKAEGVVKLKTITEVAESFGVSTRTIRYYEEIGLLAPDRSEGNQRLYSTAELAKLKLIFRGKRYGFSLDDIKEMVLLFDKDRTGRKQLERTIEYGQKRIGEIDQKIQELEEMKAEMEELLGEFTERLAITKGE